MKKEKIKIIKYNKPDCNLEKIIKLHQSIFTKNTLYTHLIYFDSNFEQFLSKLIRESKVDFFYILLVEENVRGFIHLKIIEKGLFLNNISIDIDAKGKGLGKLLLKESILQTKTKDTIFFGLDVFESNQLALNWYKKLNLQIVKESIWIKIIEKQNSLKDNSINGTTFIGTDINGFKGVYYDYKKVATIVNEGTLIINNIDNLSVLPVNDFFTIAKVDTEYCNNKRFSNYDLESIDKSYRMNGLLSKVIKI